MSRRVIGRREILAGEHVFVALVECVPTRTGFGVVPGSATVGEVFLSRKAAKESGRTYHEVCCTGIVDGNHVPLPGDTVSVGNEGGVVTVYRPRRETVTS